VTSCIEEEELTKELSGAIVMLTLTFPQMTSQHLHEREMVAQKGMQHPVQ
jgi:hypothetical protein